MRQSALSAVTILRSPKACLPGTGMVLLRWAQTSKPPRFPTKRTYFWFAIPDPIDYPFGHCGFSYFLRRPAVPVWYQRRRI